MIPWIHEVLMEEIFVNAISRRESWILKKIAACELLPARDRAIGCVVVELDDKHQH